LENVSKDVVVSDTPAVNGPVVDWVSYGAVSSVKNQGSCTASYAFSAIGAIEGVSVIFYKTANEYSVQQVIDCSQSYGNNGCVNGRMDFTFNYIKDRGKSGII
jgi:cathepsin L